MTVEIEVPGLKLIDRETEGLLSWLHRLLVAHRYDYAQSEQLEELWAVTPEAEEYYKASDLAVRPGALEVADNLLDLADRQVQEALFPGYLVGRFHNGETDNRMSLEQRARWIVERLGLEELMEANLSFGYLPTERATKPVKAMVAP